MRAASLTLLAVTGGHGVEQMRGWWPVTDKTFTRGRLGHKLFHRLCSHLRRHHSATMNPPDLPSLFKLKQISMNGHLGDLQLRCQIGDLYAPCLVQLSAYPRPSLFCRHLTQPLRQCCNNHSLLLILPKLQPLKSPLSQHPNMILFYFTPGNATCRGNFL